ncbi:guanitoxin biosynthesis heme-dependent pre-guanitoxin N-hydroxylase GntA [uncultured Sphingomonas sp.]|uniref:guanitoxin biosynthesis heme-dependent pre-guanitoxin N-hydroxylase GntA n=1 Tax=uncultured Sphingomonas sp. TaxID=158754 RepID=UPI0025EB1EB1|nr:guanitoxin biosynthesis heme-dependent pre-guanitoxin N-hydroxylase GntA [uncultured Sphingomonas sp.]
MLKSVSKLFPAHDPSEPESAAMLRDHIAKTDFPCVGAKAAMARGTLEILGARDIASAWDDLRIHDCLRRFAEHYRAEPQLFRSLAVVFAGPDTLDEAAFERAVWLRIQSLSDKDVWLGQDWDTRVSADPDDPHFSLSFGGEAFFVVGLHPNASRPARRFPRPAMIFNLHDQFEVLRAQGKYETMREKIMTRDEALAGSRNPMLARHGEMSEARQYSGRAVEEGWRCPFHYAGAGSEAKA